MFYGIKKYTDEVGSMWVRLADYHIKMGLFEKARDVFEEALGTVQAVRDFSHVYNAYVKFEESLISILDDRDASDDEDFGDEELSRKLDKLLGL
jgi:pre-mRNA-splicing factor SYF1